MLSGWYQSIIEADRALFLLFNARLSHPVLDFLFVHITDAAFWIVPGIIGVAVLIMLERKRAVLIIGLSLITVGISDPLCCRIIRPAVHRMRPCDARAPIAGGRFLLGHKRSLSFPSAHAMNSFAQAALFSLLYRRLFVWIVASGIAALVAFSRIYVGVHWPIDVASGAVLGAAVGGLVFGAYVLIHARWKNSLKPATTPAVT